MTPEELAKSQSEDGHQMALMCWCNLPEIKKLYPELQYLFAIPNGGFRHKAIAARMKATGVKRGVPDLFLPIKRGHWSGLFIELKVPKQIKNGVVHRAGSLRGNQGHWIEFLKVQGYGAMVCKGWMEAKDALTDYIRWKGGEWK